MSNRRRSLGRGLDSLLETAPETGLRELPVEELHPNRVQPRSHFDEGKLEELTQSIRAQGIVQPLIVTPDSAGGFMILAGERRWRASQRAGLKTVPVVVRQVSGDRERLELALIENIQRADLNPIEEAEAYDMLRETFGLAQEEIALRVGKSRPSVANSLRLLKLPGTIRDYLRDGRLTAGQARPLLSLEDEDRAVELARQAVEEGLTARDLEKAASDAKASKVPPKGRAEAPPKEVHTAAAEEALTQVLQTKTEIRRRGKGGVVSIHFHSEEELIRLFELLSRRGPKA